MAMEYSYKGGKQNNASALFKTMERDLEKIVNEATRMIAQELGKDASRIVPYQTGQLSRSLRIYADGTGYVVEFGKNLDYTREVYYVTAKSGHLKWTEHAFTVNYKKYILIFNKKLSAI